MFSLPGFYPDQSAVHQPQSAPTALIVGAGIGGIATSIRLAAQGYQVQVFEANPYPGGKLSEIQVGDYRFDAGPSLFTLPGQVEDLFALAGKATEAYFQYERLPVITHYFWPDGLRLQAHADLARFAQEVEAKTGEPGEQVLRLLRKSEELNDITSHVFLEKSLHKLSTFLAPETIRSIFQLHRIDAFRSMHRANASYFRDPRIVQLFDRYATYNGSDPYQAPATLNIIPHLEYNLGAYFPKGGMYQITQSLYRLALDLGVQYHLGTPVDQILVENGRAVGLRIGQARLAADVVVSNADVVPTYRRLLPDQPAPERTLRQPRSSSALIFYWGMRRSFPELDVHNIFFSDDYQEEFRYIWEKQSIFSDPTVYVNITSKRNPSDAPEGCENWFTMINVPCDQGQDWDALIPQARSRIIDKLSHMLGTDIGPLIEAEAILEPRTIQHKTSSYLGALYGSSSNNKFAAFLRHPNFSRKIDNLYFCGGSVHPGGGIPLSLLGARIVGDLVPQGPGTAVPQARSGVPS